MSTNSPAVSKRPSMSRMFSPLSSTWVRPSVRGLPGRAGTPRNPSLKPGIELLQFFLRGFLHVVVERVAVGVDPDRQRAEILDAELPQALRHQLFPRNLFDLFDLCRFQRGSAADDREIDHAVPTHRLDRLVGEAALAADGAHAVAPAERLCETHHARRGGGADADLLVFAFADLAYARRRVEQERAAEVHRRLDTLVEDPHLRPVPDADDVALDDHLVAGAEPQDLSFVGDRECHFVDGHGS